MWQVSGRSEITDFNEAATKKSNELLAHERMIALT
jgi:hypothetical protein